MTDDIKKLIEEAKELQQYDVRHDSVAWRATVLANALATTLSAVAGERDRMKRTLEGILNSKPCYDGGTIFYPHFDQDGNEIGVEHVDPIGFIGGLYEGIASALNPEAK